MNKPRPSEIYFGPTEIKDSTSPSEETGPDGVSLEFLTEALQGRRLAEDIVAAAESSGRSLFDGWLEKVNGALNDGYPVSLHMRKGGRAAVDEVLNHPLFPTRQRVHRKKLELIALQLSAQPQDDAQFKALTEYAPFLRWAALREVPPEDFAERMAGVQLKDAKTFIRALNKERKGKAKSEEQPVPDNTNPAPGETSSELQPNEETTPAPEKESGVSEETPEPSEALSEARESSPVSEPASNLPPPSPTQATSPPAAAPKKVHAARDERVRSAVTGVQVTIFDEGEKHPAGWRLTPAQAKAARAVGPKGFRDPAAYLRALADALKPRPPANMGTRIR